MGQSEIEIAGLADMTAVVLVPEAGDEVQTMKAGLMEIADMFIINKADRPDADAFVKNLRLMLAPAFHHHHKEIPILKTVAINKEGIDEVVRCMYDVQCGMYDVSNANNSKRSFLLAEKAYHIIQQNRMKSIDKNVLKNQIMDAMQQPNFNLYSFVEKYL